MLDFIVERCLHWCLQEEANVPKSEEDSVCKTRKLVVVKYCNIIDASFWVAHPEILNEKLYCSRCQGLLVV